MVMTDREAEDHESHVRAEANTSADSTEAN